MSRPLTSSEASPKGKPGGPHHTGVKKTATTPRPLPGAVPAASGSLMDLGRVMELLPVSDSLCACVYQDSIERNERAAQPVQRIEFEVGPSAHEDEGPPALSSSSWPPSAPTGDVCPTPRSPGVWEQGEAGGAAEALSYLQPVLLMPSSREETDTNGEKSHSNNEATLSAGAERERDELGMPREAYRAFCEAPVEQQAGFLATQLGRPLYTPSSSSRANPRSSNSKRRRRDEEEDKTIGVIPVRDLIITYQYLYREPVPLSSTNSAPKKRSSKTEEKKDKQRSPSKKSDRTTSGSRSGSPLTAPPSTVLRWRRGVRRTFLSEALRQDWNIPPSVEAQSAAVLWTATPFQEEEPAVVDEQKADHAELYGSLGSRPVEESEGGVRLVHNMGEVLEFYGILSVELYTGVRSARTTASSSSSTTSSSLTGTVEPYAVLVLTFRDHHAEGMKFAKSGVIPETATEEEGAACLPTARSSTSLSHGRKALPAPLLESLLCTTLQLWRGSPWWSWSSHQGLLRVWLDLGIPWRGVEESRGLRTAAAVSSWTDPSLLSLCMEWEAWNAVLESVLFPATSTAVSLAGSPRPSSQLCSGRREGRPQRCTEPLVFREEGGGVRSSTTTWPGSSVHSPLGPGLRFTQVTLLHVLSSSAATTVTSSGPAAEESPSTAKREASELGLRTEGRKPEQQQQRGKGSTRPAELGRERLLLRLWQWIHPRAQQSPPLPFFPKQHPVVVAPASELAGDGEGEGATQFSPPAVNAVDMLQGWVLAFSQAKAKKARKRSTPRVQQGERITTALTDAAGMPSAGNQKTEKAERSSGASQSPTRPSSRSAAKRVRRASPITPDPALAAISLSLLDASSTERDAEDRFVWELLKENALASTTSKQPRHSDAPAKRVAETLTPAATHSTRPTDSSIGEGTPQGTVARAGRGASLREVKKRCRSPTSSQSEASDGAEANPKGVGRRTGRIPRSAPTSPGVRLVLMRDQVGSASQRALGHRVGVEPAEGHESEESPTPGEGASHPLTAPIAMTAFSAVAATSVQRRWQRRDDVLDGVTGYPFFLPPLSGSFSRTAAAYYRSGEYRLLRSSWFPSSPPPPALLRRHDIRSTLSCAPCGDNNREGVRGAATEASRRRLRERKSGSGQQQLQDNESPSYHEGVKPTASVESHFCVQPSALDTPSPPSDLQLVLDYSSSAGMSPRSAISNEPCRSGVAEKFTCHGLSCGTSAPMYMLEDWWVVDDTASWNESPTSTTTTPGKNTKNNGGFASFSFPPLPTRPPPFTALFLVYLPSLSHLLRGPPIASGTTLSTVLGMKKAVGALSTDASKPLLSHTPLYAALRALFTLWSSPPAALRCAFRKRKAASLTGPPPLPEQPETETKEGGEYDVTVKPRVPATQRLILLVVAEESEVDEALLSWTEQAFSEHNLSLPIMVMGASRPEKINDKMETATPMTDTGESLSAETEQKQQDASLLLLRGCLQQFYAAYGVSRSDSLALVVQPERETKERSTQEEAPIKSLCTRSASEGDATSLCARRVGEVLQDFVGPAAVFHTAEACREAMLHLQEIPVQRTISCPSSAHQRPQRGTFWGSSLLQKAIEEAFPFHQYEWWLAAAAQGLSSPRNRSTDDIKRGPGPHVPTRSRCSELVTARRQYLLKNMSAWVPLAARLLQPERASFCAQVQRRPEEEAERPSKGPGGGSRGGAAEEAGREEREISIHCRPRVAMEHWKLKVRQSPLTISEREQEDITDFENLKLFELPTKTRPISLPSTTMDSSHHLEALTTPTASLPVLDCQQEQPLEKEEDGVVHHLLEELPLTSLVDFLIEEGQGGHLVWAQATHQPVINDEREQEEGTQLDGASWRRSSHKKQHSEDGEGGLRGSLTIGMVLPVTEQRFSFVPLTAPRESRRTRLHAPQLRLPMPLLWPALRRFGEYFFGKSVMAIASDLTSRAAVQEAAVERSEEEARCCLSSSSTEGHSLAAPPALGSGEAVASTTPAPCAPAVEPYCTNYSCAAEGYLRYRVSCVVRRFVVVHLVIDLLPLIEWQQKKQQHQQRNAEPPSKQGELWTGLLPMRSASPLLALPQESGNQSHCDQVRMENMEDLNMVDFWIRELFSAPSLLPTAQPLGASAQGEKGSGLPHPIVVSPAQQSQDQDEDGRDCLAELWARGLVGPHTSSLPSTIPTTTSPTPKAQEKGNDPAGHRREALERSAEPRSRPREREGGGTAKTSEDEGAQRSTAQESLDWSEVAVLPYRSCTCTPRRHEKVEVGADGVKCCRHMAEVWLTFLHRQVVLIPPPHQCLSSQNNKTPELCAVSTKM